jgi:hypothetical protein
MAGIIEAIRSLSRCAPLSASRIGKSGRCETVASVVMPDPWTMRLGASTGGMRMARFRQTWVSGISCQGSGIARQL